MFCSYSLFSTRIALGMENDLIPWTNHLCPQWLSDNGLAFNYRRKGIAEPIISLFSDAYMFRVLFMVSFLTRNEKLIKTVSLVHVEIKTSDIGITFWKSSLKWLVFKFDVMEDNVFLVLFLLFYIYLDASQYDNTLFSFNLFLCLN